MIDPITTGMICLALVMLALIGKSWAERSGAVRVEIAKIEAQRRGDDADRDLSLAIEQGDEAIKAAKRAAELAERFESRLSAAENRARR
jgi:hypothetical protein